MSIKLYPLLALCQCTKFKIGRVLYSLLNPCKPDVSEVIPSNTVEVNMVQIYPKYFSVKIKLKIKKETIMENTVGVLLSFVHLVSI